MGIFTEQLGTHCILDQVVWSSFSPSGTRLHHDLNSSINYYPLAQEHLDFSGLLLLISRNDQNPTAMKVLMTELTKIITFPVAFLSFFAVSICILMSLRSAMKV